MAKGDSMAKTWKEIIEEEKQQEYFQLLMNKVDKLYKTSKVFPPKEELFSCFDLCNYENTKVVILGQDPYHGEGQAHGLSFSVKKGIKTPPSLRNIYKELNSDLGLAIPSTGNLEDWARQGVLLMNTTWTVEEGKPASHKDIGWQTFSLHILDILNDFEEPLVFVLWGKHAQEIANGVITNPKHLIIESAHPSPFAANRGFFGSKVFSKINKFLEEQNRTPIDWEIKEDHQTSLDI